MRVILPFSLLLGLLTPSVLDAAETDPKTVAFFEKKIRPLLSDKCYSCHGPQKQKGDLRVDSRSALLQGGESGPAIVPGKPEQSLLISAVRHNEALKMPPKDKLSTTDIAALTEWVRDGALWPDDKSVAPQGPKQAVRRPFTAEEKSFWAFQSLRFGEPPVVKNARWVRNPIDRYILAKLEAAKLAPAPETDKRTLLRRITLDLTGLLPTPQEIEAFVNDTSSDAWDRVIERLLASPAYGEKWGRRWLDVARYADSNGMDENLAHANAWRYRDYVINAFNSDKPYDRFVKEQIAGDLMGGETPAERAERLIATGFLVIGPKMLAEDDPMKMRMDIIDEQIDTIGQSMLGLTLGCARCHDHKFDPITMADYYGLAGILYSTKTMQSFSVVARWHERPLDGTQSATAVAELEKKLTMARTAANRAEKQLRAAALTRLDKERKRFADYAAAALLVSAAGSPKLVVADPAKTLPEGSILVEAEAFTRGNALKLMDGYGAGIGVIINSGKLPNIAEYDLEIPAEGTYQIALRYAAAEARPTKLFVNGKLICESVAAMVTGSWNPDKQAWFAETIVQLPKGKATIKLERDAPFPHLDRLALLRLNPEQIKAIPRTLEQVAAENELLVAVLREWLPHAKKWQGKLPTADELMQLANDANGPFRATPAVETEIDPNLAAEARKLRAEFTNLEKAKPPVETCMAVEDEKPQNIRIHLRGNHLTLGSEVPRQFPIILAGDTQTPVPSSRSGRLDLAEWIASKDNPLTARVMVNRIWLGHFGTGLVRSPDNFGRLGHRPTHPELLDYLADQFIRSGWSIKQMHRLIVNSAAYRMSTRHDGASFRADPENTLLWKFNRRRLEAEELRDGMLQVAGVLQNVGGGATLKVGNRQYVNTTASRNFDGYSVPRRSVYLPVIRSAVYDVLQTNDFPDPSTPNGMRASTTIPAQALLLMNSSLADQASEAFARSLLATPGDEATRIREAYRRAFGRVPTSPEIARVRDYLQRSVKIASGDLTPEEKQLQAWRGFCRVLFASTEFTFVE